jgi:transcriptional regulator with XRE-family HTH domain
MKGGVLMWGNHTPLGERIRERRLYLKKTVVELANEAEISDKTLYRYEKKKVDSIPSEVVIKLARALKVRIDTLLCAPDGAFGFNGGILPEDTSYYEIPRDYGKAEPLITAYANAEEWQRRAVCVLLNIPVTEINDTLVCIEPGMPEYEQVKIVLDKDDKEHAKESEYQYDLWLDAYCEAQNKLSQRLNSIKDCIDRMAAQNVFQPEFLKVMQEHWQLAFNDYSKSSSANTGGDPMEKMETINSKLDIIDPFPSCVYMYKK